MSIDPNGAVARTYFIMSGYPHPLPMGSSPITFDPHMTRAWRYRDHFMSGLRRFDGYDDFSRGRRLNLLVHNHVSSRTPTCERSYNPRRRDNSQCPFHMLLLFWLLPVSPG